MKNRSIQFAKDLAKPAFIRWALIIWALISAYDTLSSQLELPTIRKILGLSGALMPWWGWLLVLQAILSIALFDYVRRSSLEPIVPNEHPGLGEFELTTSVLEGETNALNQKFESVMGRVQSAETILANVNAAVEDHQWAILAIYHRERFSN